MAQLQSIREQRYEQIYPTLDSLEIERVRRFGELRSFAAGESLWSAGKVASGLMVILMGKVTEREIIRVA
jgi:thioredoxin reductase (NADPH)